jgi:hypothetical protein
VEAGLEFKNNFDNSFKFYTRLPLTDKKNNLAQIDRYSNTWKIVSEYNYIKDFTFETGAIKRLMITMQGEYGYSKYKYYPTAIESEELSEWNSSYSGEIKFIWYKADNAKSSQFSPQFRIRYSYNWNSADEVGILNSQNANGIFTVTNMVIDKPYAKSVLSPAFVLQYYPGVGAFSYGPTIYYDLQGKTNNNNPFNNLERLRLEFWVFYYPKVEGTPNFKIGVSPFLNVRTKGTDKLNKIEYGGIFTIKYNTNLLKFF